MKFAISMLFLVIAGTTLAAPPSKRASAPKLQSVAVFTHDGGDCNSAPIEVTIITEPIADCKPEACKPQFGSTSGLKEVKRCVSANSALHLGLIKKTFKSKPFLLNTSFKLKTNCTGKPFTLNGRLADGTCLNSGKRFLNKDMSMIKQSFMKGDCSDEPWENITEPAGSDTLNGQKCVADRTLKVFRNGSK